MVVKKIFICDVCNHEFKTGFIEDNIQVIFHTKQTEGYPVKPYLSTCKIDICEECKIHLLKGNYLHANGAQGCNTYSFQ